MAEYMHLIGVEQIQSAANRMMDAAERMNRAANTMHEVLSRHETAMESFALKIDELLDELDNDEEI